jgi:hypothetical protein
MPIRGSPGLNRFENRFSLSQIHIEPFFDVDLIYAAPGPSDADVGFIEFSASYPKKVYGILHRPRGRLPADRTGGAHVFERLDRVAAESSAMNSSASPSGV